MTRGDTTFTDRAANRTQIARLLQNRHARKDMLTGLFREHFTFATSIRCEAPDHVVHLNPCDSTITPAVLSKGHWNRPELERAIAVLRDNDVLRDGGTFLDVGGNIGTQTIYAMLSKAFRAVHAFEPEPDNAALFEMNIAENRMTDDVRLFTLAVGDHEGQVSLRRHRANFGAHSIVPPTDGGGGEGEELTVSLTTLDAHLARAGISPRDIGLVWIDVEGAEPDVVAGAASVLTARTPIVFEFLDRDRNRPEVIGMFARLRDAYSHAFCLQDETMTAFDTKTLTHDLPEGDYLVFSHND